jgi:hypothetical protein
MMKRCAMLALVAGVMGSMQGSAYLAKRKAWLEAQKNAPDGRTWFAAVKRTVQDPIWGGALNGVAGIATYYVLGKFTRDDQGNKTPLAWSTKVVAGCLTAAGLNVAEHFTAQGLDNTDLVVRFGSSAAVGGLGFGYGKVSPMVKERLKKLEKDSKAAKAAEAAKLLETEKESKRLADVAGGGRQGASRDSLLAGGGSQAEAGRGGGAGAPSGGQAKPGAAPAVGGVGALTATGVPAAADAHPS